MPPTHHRYSPPTAIGTFSRAPALSRFPAPTAPTFQKNSYLGGKPVKTEPQAIFGTLRRTTANFKLKNEMIRQNRKGHRWMEEGILARVAGN
jgi:hypothetical protein